MPYRKNQRAHWPEAFADQMIHFCLVPNSDRGDRVEARATRALLMPQYGDSGSAVSEKSQAVLMKHLPSL